MNFVAEKPSQLQLGCLALQIQVRIPLENSVRCVRSDDDIYNGGGGRVGIVFVMPCQQDWTDYKRTSGCEIGGERRHLVMSTEAERPASYHLFHLLFHFPRRRTFVSSYIFRISFSVGSFVTLERRTRLLWTKFSRLSLCFAAKWFIIHGIFWIMIHNPSCRQTPMFLTSPRCFWNCFFNSVRPNTKLTSRKVHSKRPMRSMAYRAWAVNI